MNIQDYISENYGTLYPLANEAIIQSGISTGYGRYPRAIDLLTGSLSSEIDETGLDAAAVASALLDRVYREGFPVFGFELGDDVVWFRSEDQAKSATESLPYSIEIEQKMSYEVHSEHIQEP